jgi:hypothetical protein
VAGRFIGFLLSPQDSAIGGWHHVPALAKCNQQQRNSKPVLEEYWRMVAGGDTLLMTSTRIEFQ